MPWQQYCQYLQVDVCYVFAQRHSCLTINNLHSYWGIAFGLQDIINQILGGKVDVAAPVRVVLTEHTLWV
jgi:hypothetical protein